MAAVGPRRAEFLWILLVGMCVPCWTKKDTNDPYDGLSMLKVKASTEDGLRILRDVYPQEGVDMWTPPRTVGEEVTMILSREKHNELTTLFSLRGKDFQITGYNDVKRILDKTMREYQERAHIRNRAVLTSPPNASINLDEYHTYSEIMHYLDSLDSLCPRCQVEDIGETYEGRKMKVIKISGVSDVETRPIYWMDAGIHAREWISPATALFFIDQLVNIETADPYTRKILGSFDWYILPLLNPDGYQYTWTSYRYWRGNRSPNPDAPECPGKDLNRNFDFMWMHATASQNPCSQVYAGPFPESELETQAISRFLNRHKSNLVGFMTLHAFSQMWLVPWSYTTERPEGFDDMMAVGNAAADAIYDLNNHNYSVGASPDILYPAGGCSFDWSFAKLGVKYSACIELQPGDRSKYDFVLPPEMIQGQGQEIVVAMTAACAEMLIQMST